MPPYYFLAVDLEVVKELLPLGDTLVTGVLTVITPVITYFLGRKRQKQEIENLQAEKKSIEAASGLSTAEAAQVISEAAAATVQPLIDRVHRQQDEIKYLTDRLVWKRGQMDEMRTDLAKLRAELELYRQKQKLQGKPLLEFTPEDE